MKKSYFIYLLCASTMLTFSAWAASGTAVEALDCTPGVDCPEPTTPGDSPDTGIGGFVDTATEDPDSGGDTGGGGTSGSGGSGFTQIGEIDSGVTGSAEGYVPDPDNLNCHNVSCAALGYAQATISGCETYIKCPFDVSYQACAKYKDEFTLSSCPSGANCEGKFKVTGCQEGYIEGVNINTGAISCTPKVETCTYTLTSCPTGWECTNCSKDGTTYYAKTDNCAIGYEKGNSHMKKVTGISGAGGTTSSLSGTTSSLRGTTSSLAGSSLPIVGVRKTCYKTVCKVTSQKGGYVYESLDNGGYVAVECEDGYAKKTNANGCINCKQVTLNPDSFCQLVKCPEGAGCDCSTLSSGTLSCLVTSCAPGYTLNEDANGCKTCTKTSTHFCQTETVACSGCALTSNCYVYTDGACYYTEPGSGRSKVLCRKTAFVDGPVRVNPELELTYPSNP